MKLFTILTLPVTVVIFSILANVLDPYMLVAVFVLHLMWTFNGYVIGSAQQRKLSGLIERADNNRIVRSMPRQQGKTVELKNCKRQDDLEKIVKKIFDYDPKLAPYLLTPSQVRIVEDLS